MEVENHMKDYYSLFVELSLKQCTENDYGNEAKVKEHNLTMRKLKKLRAEMAQTDCTEALNRLLNHEDDRVKINASAFCLQEDVMSERAVRVLKTITDTSKDSTIRFAADMLLRNIDC